MKTFVKLVLAVGVALPLISAVPQASATLGYFQGFENDNSGWTVGSGYGLAINRVPSGGGTLNLTSSSEIFGGGYYGEMVNDPGSISATLGSGGYTWMPSPGSVGRDPVYHGDFFQFVDIYIDTQWAPPAAPASPAFILDEVPTATNGLPAYGPPYSSGVDEKNFAFYVPLVGTVDVKSGYSTPLLTITNSGWYSFAQTYRRTGPSATDYVANDFLVYDHSGKLLASNTLSSTLPSYELGGNGLLWFANWQNGFANNVLGIDNTWNGLLPLIIPEPSPMFSAALSLVACCIFFRRSKLP